MNKVGDIFTVPIQKEKIGYGQIIGMPNKSYLFIVIYDIVGVDSSFNINEIVNSKILFMGYTLDAKLYHNHWVVVGNSVENIKTIKLPYFKLGALEDDCRLTDFQGRVLRSCTQVEFETLNYQKVIAPVRYENGLKAYHKVAEWKEDYDEMLADNYLEGSSRVIV